MTRRLRVPSTESLFVGAFVLFAVRLGSLPIGDNSMFVHLRTGKLIADSGGIPRRDPYSYTAAGEPWVVQSWLPSWTYGWLDRLGGLRLVVLEQAVLMALLAWLVVRLARAGTPLRTMAAGGIVVGIGAPFWTPRPFLFGLVAMALTITVVERGHSRWWLLPIAWVWVNSHGSFPLGLVWLVLSAAGDGFDRRAWPRERLVYIHSFVLGMLAGAVSPLGPRLLTFPFTIGEKREVFRSIVEWRSPDFQSTAGLFAAVFLGLALLVLLRGPLRWGDVLPAAAFVVLGLLAMRNVAVAAVVLAVPVGRALRAPRPAGGSGAAAAQAPARPNLVFAGVLAAGIAIFVSAIWTRDPIDDKGYPVAAVDYLQRQGLLEGPHRVAYQDITGCYLVLRFGGRVPVFIDDRYDMYPLAVARDYDRLLDVDRRAFEVLDRRDIDVVLWEEHGAFATLLRATDDWRQVYDRDGFVVLRRSGS